MTIVQAPAWPDGDPGKVLLHFVAECSVDALWEDFFGSYPVLQAKLHKQRNDTNCAESPWVSTRQQLPVQQFVWPAPPAGADPGTAAQGKIRKVRFEAAPSLASKAFSSEEIQKILSYQPGKHYLVESEVYTTAMYGEHFCVLSRTSMVARGSKQCQLQLVYTIAFKPSLSRLMRPMVAKGVDGGIRGTFSALKKLLQEQYNFVDLPDTTPPPAVPSALLVGQQPTVEPTAPALARAAAAAPAAPAGSLLFTFADYIVYQELVASILKVSDPQLVAKGLAMCLTLLLIQLLITMLQPVAQSCAVAAAAAQAGGQGGLLRLLCWPFVSWSIPTDVGQVVMSLLLVALANKLLLIGAEVLAIYARAVSAAPTQTASHDSATSTTGQAAAGTPADSNVADSTQPQPAAAEMASDLVQGTKQRKGRRALPDASSASAASGSISAANASGSSEGFSLVQNFGSMMSGWGATMDEGFKALISGSWSRSAASDAKTTTSQLGGGEGPGSADGHTGNSSSLVRSISHRHTTSFTAVMDPSGLNIIEDYAAQLKQLTELTEEQQDQTGPLSATSVAGSRAAELYQPPTGAAIDGRSGASTPAPRSAAAGAGLSTATGQGESREIPTGSSKNPAGSRSPSPTKHSSRASSRMALAADDEEEEKAVVQLLLNHDGEAAAEIGDSEQDDTALGSAVISVSDRSPASAEKHASYRSGSRSQQSSTPSPQAAQPLPKARSAGKMISDPKNVVSNGLQVDASATSFSVGSVGKTASRLERGLARRSASPMLYGAGGGDKGSSSSLASSRPGSRSNMREASVPPYQALAASDVGKIVPGEEEEDEVCVEVFEHERVQPFRGWGHTWPGHFLPSDKVGHWGDRSGAPGGQLSMLFDRVAPKPPPGWEWRDDEWQVDFTGADVEGCDSEGWSYGMDFSWLTWPPAPQSGKPGIKSFVRRRRWTRTRRRLPPGSVSEAAATAASEDQGVLVEAPEMSSSPLQGEGSGGLGLSLRRAGGSEGGSGLMAGLGVGLGGLVSGDSGAAAAATAAVASATAMMNRFMKAVTEGPLPAGLSNEPEAAGSLSAATASPSGTATGVGLASPKQVATGSASAAVETSAATGSNSDEDDSSSVDSDLIPTRPHLIAVPEGWKKTQLAGPQADLEARENSSIEPTGDFDTTAAAAAAAAVSTGDSAMQAQQGPEQARQQQPDDAATISPGPGEAVAGQSTGDAIASTQEPIQASELPAASTSVTHLLHQSPVPTAESGDAVTTKLNAASKASVTPTSDECDADKGKQQEEQAVHEMERFNVLSPQPAVNVVSSTNEAGSLQSSVTTGNVPEIGATRSAASTVEESPSAASHAASATVQPKLMAEGNAAEQQTGPTAVAAPLTADLPVFLPIESDAVDVSRAEVGGQVAGSDWVWTTAASENSSNGSTGVVSADIGSSDSADQATCHALAQEGLIAEPQAAAHKAAAVQQTTTSIDSAATLHPHAMTADVAALSSQSSSGLSVIEGVSVNNRLSSSGSGGISSARTSHSVVAEGRRAGRRSSSGGGVHHGGSKTAGVGRPRLGAVSLKQTAGESGLRPSGGSGVISPTATAAAAAADSEWESKSQLKSQSSSHVGVMADDEKARLSGSPTAIPGSSAKLARTEVDTADDMGSGLVSVEGADADKEGAANTVGIVDEGGGRGTTSQS